MKYARLQLTFIFLLLQVLTVCGQGEADILNTITLKFNKYLKAVPREEIFVHTDRSMYISGEEFWFSIYLIDRQSGAPGNRSKLTYVELLNSDNRPVIQKRIRLEDGVGPGQFTLPDTLSTGRYTFRAYTNWMKNFLPDNCFTKEVLIYNAISEKTLQGNSPALHRPDEPIENGESPGLSERGFQLEVDNLRADTVVLSIVADKNFRTENKNLCFIFIHTNGKINYSTSIRLYSGNTQLELEKDLMSPGVNQIALFDSKGALLTTKYIYTPSGKSYSMDLHFKDSLGLREKVYMEIVPTMKSTDSVGTNISISVAPLLTNIDHGLADYMVFGTEFGILPEEIKNKSLEEIPNELIDKFLSGTRSRWFDWNMIMSGDIPEFKYPKESSEHFLSGKLISQNNMGANSTGCLFLSTPGKNAIFRYSRTGKDGSFNFSLPIGEEIQDIIIQPEKVDDHSTVRIEPSYYEEYISSSGPDNTETDIPGFISMLSINHQVSKIYEIAFLGEPVSSGLKMPEPKRFYGKPDIELRLADYIDLPVMQEVFFELTPGVILKNKKSAYYLTIADRADGRILDKPPITFIDGVVVNDPSVIAELDPDKVEKIDAVKELYMVGDYMFFGIVNVITKAGDYSMVTLPDYAVRLKYRVVEPVRTFLSLDYTNGEKKQSRIPDFRNTLYWNPSMKPDADGKIRVGFWSPDVTGDYEVNIQGISTDGKPLSIRKVFRIR